MLISGFKNRHWYGLRRNHVDLDGRHLKGIVWVLPGYNNNVPSKNEFYKYGVKPLEHDEVVAIRLVFKRVVPS